MVGTRIEVTAGEQSSWINENHPAKRSRIYRGTLSQTCRRKIFNTPQELTVFYFANSFLFFPCSSSRFDRKPRELRGHPLFVWNIKVSRGFQGRINASGILAGEIKDHTSSLKETNGATRTSRLVEDK